MSGAQFGAFILALIGVAIVVAIVVWLLNWLYLRSSKERAFVRTGFRGQRVVLNGGALVLPIVHAVIPVNMNTLRLEVSRGRDKALITRDRMRVDVVAEFYVRVKAEVAAIAAAAQTLGQRTMEPETLKELVEGKFVDAMRTVAAEMTMEELHEKRGEYVKRVRAVVAADLLQNGLELETVSLTQLDQTAMEFFNPSNAFDAEGLTRLTEQIERRKKIRNDIEQDTMIQIRNKNLDTEKQALDIDRELEYARLAQERELEIQRAGQRAEVAREKAAKELEAERAQISAREAVERARLGAERAVEGERIAKEREIEQSEIARRKAIELAEQERAIAVAEQSRAQSEAQGAADQARARAVADEERVFTARETEMAERRKRIELIGAAQDAERMRVGAEAEADAEKIRALAARIRHEVEAEGTRLMNEAQNLLSPEARLSAMRRQLIDKLEGIIRESVKPMERIESIRILQTDGLGGGGGGRGGAEGASLADNVVNSALRYRAQAPLVDQLLREIGIDAGDVGKVARGLMERGPAKPALDEGGSGDNGVG
ncbi:MAG: flotillin family protein [Vicinamibacterales bacterium]